MATRVFIYLLIVAVALALILAGCLYSAQERIIYHPRSYERGEMFQLHPLVRELMFETAQGRQVCYYLPPGQSLKLSGSKDAALKEDFGEPPEAVWVFFGGNASLALHWIWMLQSRPDENIGYLLVEYPGYGSSAGRPSPSSILEASEGALTALAHEFGIEPDGFDGRLHALGHSLGAAAALQFAARQPVERVILLAPFTSLRALAREMVGGPLSRVLRHNFDNRARLDELADRDEPPTVFIIHSRQDNVVPFAMSKELAAAHPEIIDLIAIDGDHETPIDEAAERLPELMGLAPAD